MLQNSRKTLGFKKNMVYKIPPGGGGKPYPASGLLATELSIATGDKWQSKTLFLSIFYPRSSIVENFFNCRLPGVAIVYVYFRNHDPRISAKSPLTKNYGDICQSYMLTKKVKIVTV